MNRNFWLFVPGKEPQLVSAGYKDLLTNPGYFHSTKNRNWYSVCDRGTLRTIDAEQVPVEYRTMVLLLT